MEEAFSASTWSQEGSDGGTPDAEKYVARKRRPRQTFSREEDAIITGQVNIRGEKGWSEIAAFLPNRTARQVRERWVNYLSPNVSRKEWTKTEDFLLERLVAELGPQWSKIAALFPSRTDVLVKNRAALIKRQIKRGKRISLFKAKTPEAMQILNIKKKYFIPFNELPDDNSAQQEAAAVSSFSAANDSELDFSIFDTFDDHIEIGASAGAIF